MLFALGTTHLISGLVQASRNMCHTSTSCGLSSTLQSNIQKILDDAGVTDTSTLNEMSQVTQDGLVSWQGTQRLKETEALRRKVEATDNCAIHITSLMS